VNEEFDNSAKRLLALLNSGRSIQQTRICRDVWHELLDTGRDEAQLMTRLGKVMALPGEVVAAMSKYYPHQSSVWSHWFAQVNHAFINQQLSGQWASFITAIDVHSFNYLSMTADMLANRETVKTIDPNKLTELRDQLAEFVSEILKSDIDVGVKDTLARHVQRLIVALDEYRFTGTMPILDAVDAAIGHVMRDLQYSSTLKSSEFGARFINLLSVASSMVTVVQGYPQLAAGFDAAKKALGW
jgi:hypothetical protein